MKNAKVISFKALKNIKDEKEKDRAYLYKIKRMDKFQLLEEMVRFQEERSQKDELTLNLMIKGQVLFKALEEHAETEALRSLSSSYCKHLAYELEEYLKNA